MINTELTLDQLTSIAGGVVMRPDGKSCTDHLKRVPEIELKLPKVERLGPDWWYEGKSV